MIDVENSILQICVSFLFLIMHSVFAFFISILMQPLLWFGILDIPTLRASILQTYHQHEGEKYLDRKSYALEISEDGFIRYKRVWKNNKAEFFSVKIDKVKDLDYLGDEKAGWLILSCEPETVIYQTRSDPSGNIDSMANEISFPVSAISETELNSFLNNFHSLKEIISER